MFFIYPSMGMSVNEMLDNLIKRCIYLAGKGYGYIRLYALYIKI